MEKNVIYCLKYADAVLSEAWVFDGGNEDEMILISYAIYLIKTADKMVLGDAGCDMLSEPDIKDFCSPMVVLRSIGVSEEEITDIIITHAHYDHIQAVGYFKNAVIHISESEYQKGKEYIPEHMKVNSFQKELIIDPQIKVIEWGGHSEGSSIIEIETDTQTHILAGDECYTNENINKKRCTGAFFSKEKAMEFVEEYGDRRYCVHTCHERSLITKRVI